MKPVKSLFLKTYGKQMRKLSAWISPQDRKRAFESTESDDSVFESAKPRRTRGKRTQVCRQDVRLAKKKAMQQLVEKSFDENSLINENFNQPAQQNYKTRGRKASVFSRTSNIAGHPVRRRANLRSTEASSSEENSSEGPCTLNKNKKVLRKNRLVSAPVLTKRKRLKITFTSDSEEENAAPKLKKKSVTAATDSNVYPLSAGRFVTRRRCGGLTRLTKAAASLHSSSDDFTSEQVFRPTRRKKAPVAFGLCSSESSVNDVGMSNCTANPLQEISLNASVERSLGPCLRKPIFCSTPSAGFFRKQKPSEAFPTCDQGSSPPSMSVSYIGASHEDLFSFRQPVPSAQPESDCGLHSEDRQQSKRNLYHIEEQSGDLFVEPKESSCSKAKSVGGASQVVNLISIDSDGSSCFVSAEGGLEWLIQALKEECLSRHCTVQVDRLGLVLVSQLGDTTYSSCLERSSSVSSLQTASLRHLVGNGKTSNWTSSVSDLQASSPVDQKKSSDCLNPRATKKQSESDGSTYPSDFNCDVSAHSPVGTCAKRFMSEGGKAAHGARSLQNHQLKDIMQPKKAAFGSSMSSQEINQSTDFKRTCTVALFRGETTNHLKAAAKMPDPEKSASPLWKECLTSRPVVPVKKVRLSELKETLQIKDATQKSSDVSESDGDRQAKTVLLCDGDESISTSKASVRRRKASSGERNSCTGATKHKKKPVGDKKRKSTTADTSNTTRKACVSGMSVSRWKNKGGNFRSRAEQTGCSKTVDCSISELISARWKQPQELLTNPENVFTPLKANLPPLLANLTPSTHTWSRIKAALSVHRKGMVQLTPRSLWLSETPRRSMANVSQDLFATPLRTPLPKHLRSQLLSQHSLVVNEEPELSDAEKVYAECGQQHPLPWEECILPLRSKGCVKIGEGTFGEVFSTTNAAGETVALKIIPIEGSEKVNGEDQKTFGEILHEVIISKELSSLKEKQHNQTYGFIGLNDLHCVQGCYPSDFLKAWDAYDRRKGSENDRPDFFTKEQLFIILEFEFGGVDLENSNGTLASLGVAKSILHQVTAALAVAEQELHFEHRDLHWGNVLVKTTRQRKGSFLLNGTTHHMETKGVLVRIIDYSLSRLEIDELTVSCDISNDEELFMGQGDYQFEIYRLMRQENGNDWSSYHPHSNVLWLHYLCSKLLSMKYRSSGSKGAKDTREALSRFYDNILQYNSATEALRNCAMFQ